MVCTGWADLPLDLVDDVMAYLPLPADRARFAAVCRAWRSAARQFASRMPWIVLPSGGVCTTIGHDAAFFWIPGLPDKTTCLGATDDWLALDCTDDTCRRTPLWVNYCPDTGTFKNDPRPDIKHRHKYMLYNLFSKVTVPLPELDAIIGYVTETFEVRKVLMRSSSTPDDVIAITTNHCEYNVILCRPGKGTFVLPYYKVIDVAFVGDTLYGITTSEELLAFHLGEDKDGRPNLTRIRRAISNPLLDEHGYNDDGEVVLNNSNEESDDHEENEEELQQDNEEDEETDDDEEPYNEEEEEVQEDDEEDEESDEEEAHQEEEVNNESNDDEVVNQAWHIVDDGCTAPDNEEDEGFVYNEQDEGPYEPRDGISTGRYLVQSCSGELLLVRHRSLISADYDSYTLKVEVFKADLCAGKWACSNRLAKGEALFLSRSVSKCTRVCGDIQEGFVYYTAHLKDVFDTTSLTTRQTTFVWPWQCIRRESYCFLTWFFPPKELLV